MITSRNPNGSPACAAGNPGLIFKQPPVRKLFELFLNLGLVSKKFIY